MKTRPKYIELSLFAAEEESDNRPAPSKSDTGRPFANKEYDFTALFERLAKSAFRSRFHLSAKDKAYIADKGMDTIRCHAAEFIAKRLAPALIANDGKQTPMRGHPVFLAQHATGCCCRGCLYKWHHISPGRLLTQEEQQYIVEVLVAWIERQIRK